MKFVLSIQIGLTGAVFKVQTVCVGLGNSNNKKTIQNLINNNNIEE